MERRSIGIGVVAVVALAALSLSVAIVAQGQTLRLVEPARAQDGSAKPTPASDADLQRQKMEEVARQAGIDPAGLTDDQLKAAIAGKGGQDEVDQKKAEENLTTEQIHQILENNARAWGIDPTGMTSDQIKKAIAAKAPDHGQKSGQGQEHESLLMDAKNLGIDPTGMTDDQLKAAIDAKK